MWYLSQLQEYLNERFLGSGSPSRKKCNATKIADSPAKRSHSLSDDRSNDFNSLKVSETPKKFGAGSQDVWTD